MAFLVDGYRTLISFSLLPGVHLLEISVTPPGIDGGDQINVTTMRNNLVRTFAPQFLQTLTEVSLVVAYDPAIYDQIETQLVNENGQIMLTFSSGQTLTFWGYLKSFTPNESSMGDRPTANCVVVPTLLNDSGVETAF